MVKVSHARCRQCGQTRHRNAKFNLCGRCWRLKKGEVQSGWRTIKDRRAAKRNGTVVQEAELIVAAAIEEEIELPRGRAPTLTPEQEQEIVNLYTTTTTPVREIAETYGIPETGPFRILAKNGVSWRRGDSPDRKLPPHIEAMKEVHVAATPAPTPAPRSDKFEIVQPEPQPTVEDTAQVMAEMFDKVFPPQADASLPRFAIEFRATLVVHARSAGAAIAEAEAQGFNSLDVDVVRRLA